MAAPGFYRRGRAGASLLAGLLGGILGCVLTLAYVKQTGWGATERTSHVYRELLYPATPVEGEPIVKAVEKVGPAVVNINTLARAEATPMEQMFGGGEGERVLQGQGSGFIINAEKGYVVTNNHVVAEAQQITVTLPDKREFPAEVVGRDPYSDVAVVRLKFTGKLPEATLGDSDHLRIGQTVVAIGNPYGFHNTVTTGVVSAMGRRLDPNPGEHGPGLENLIQTDAAINPGNSGGPLCDNQGVVVGMDTAIYARGQGLGFAVPVNSIKHSVDNILKYGEGRRPWMGISMGDLSTRAAKELGVPVQGENAEGVLIAGVVPNGPADHAGIQKYDVITQVGGQPTKRKEDLIGAVLKANIDDTLDVKGFRGSKPMTWTVKIGKMPPPDALPQ